jgi:hypothetical protein
MLRYSVMWRKYRWQQLSTTAKDANGVNGWSSPLAMRVMDIPRIDSTGKAIPAAVWIQSCGGGRPTVYGGDTEMGICSTCDKMMSYGVLKAFLNPDHKCDARCTSARGHNCECSCGGVNHGVAA